MTKAIPAGAPRIRPARVCVCCRTSKVKCLGAEVEAETDKDCKATKKCDRCEAQGLTCEFVKSKRMGRPRRLPKDTSFQQQDEGDERVAEENDSEHLEGESRVFTRGDREGSGQTSYPTPEGSSASSSHFSGSHTIHSPLSSPTSTDQLVYQYLTEIHPYFPLLPPSLPFLITYLENSLTTTTSLSFGVSTLLAASFAPPLAFEDVQLSPTLYGAQTAMCLFYSCYGKGDVFTARLFINWVYETIRREEWYIATGSGAEKEMANRVYWEASAVEILFAVTSGVRVLQIQELRIANNMLSEEDLRNPTFLAKVQALTLIRDLMDPSLSPTPLQSEVIVTRSQSLIQECDILFNSSFLRSDITLLPVDVQAAILASDEQSFFAFLVASAALINCLSSSASLASSGFTCGIDATNAIIKGLPLLPSKTGQLPANDAETRAVVGATCNNVFRFLEEALSAPFSNRPHSPFFSCSLLIAATGIITYDGAMPSHLPWLNQGSTRASLGSNLDLAIGMLKQQSQRWFGVNKVLKEVEFLRSVLMEGMSSEDEVMVGEERARELVTMFDA